MAYDIKLATRVRKFLNELDAIEITEKKMFGGLAFMINDKMCINVSGIQLMCRFDPKQTDELSSRIGYQPMIMKGKVYKGYCYIDPEGFKSKKDFEFWLKLCLDYNAIAKSSKEKTKKRL